jgi:signal transduction histidine kinase
MTAPSLPNVLIVDDIPENISVLGAALRTLCGISFATSGAEALEMVAKDRPDLILLDVMMPGMSGPAVMVRLKADPELREIPVIFVTARTDAKSESEALRAGAADFIHKPINPEVVRARVNIQLELVQHRRALERKVLARTQELATARQEAERANAVKTRFLKNVSHEMRTPLHGILGFAEIGLRRAGNLSASEAERYFGRVLESGRRMNTLVESLLTLTGQAWSEQTGLAESQRQSIDVPGFMAEIVDLQRLQAEKRQQQLLLDMQCAATHLEGDALRLRQVFEHLIDNALSYSPDRAAITLRLTDARLGATPGGLGVEAISIEVIDQGCGIPEKEIAAVFEPFYESTLTATGSGNTGLGLPLSRSIVSRHGGTLTLRNRTGGGLVSEVILPLQQAQTSTPGSDGLPGGPAN